MRFWHVSAATSFHSTSTLSHNSYTPLGHVGYFCKALLRCTQRCSMGLMSGDWEGQTSTWMLLSSNHWEAFLKVCLGSLSCWNTLSSFGICSFSKFLPLHHPRCHSIAVIHSYVNLYKLLNPIRAHTDPYHEII